MCTACWRSVGAGWLPQESVLYSRAGQHVWDDLPAKASLSHNPSCRHALPQAVHHYGEAFKALINEKMGDGIMSGEGLCFAPVK